MSEELEIEVSEEYRQCFTISKDGTETGCKEFKLLSEFSKRADYVDREVYRNICKECQARNSVQYRTSNTKRNKKIVESGNWEKHKKEQYPSGLYLCTGPCKKEYSVDNIRTTLENLNGFNTVCRGCRAHQTAKIKHKKRFPDQEMISYEEYNRIYLGECHEGKHRSHIANGVDRIDSNKGYVEGNVVSMCFEHNRMKMEASREKFIELCRDVVESARMREKEKPKVMAQGMLF